MAGRQRLKGLNVHMSHLEVAESLSRRMSKEPRVIGIVFLGGLTRGFADEYSDIDIVAITARRDAKLKRELEAVGRATGAMASVDVDLEVHSLRDFERLRRTDWRRWEYSRAKIVLDRGGRIKRAISRMTSVPESHWVDRIVESWTHLQWYACPAEGNKSIAEIWMERGDPFSGHCCVNYSLELLTDLIFSLNREFVPAPKWRWFCLKSLAWTPRGIERALGEALAVRSFEGLDVQRRISSLGALRSQLEAKVLEVTGMTQEQLVGHFLRKAVFEVD